jgi:UDP-N-acetylglucosamine 4,6-dehydratase/5-epimerase
MRKVLITGGSGFLGRRLGRALLEKGNDVVLAARNNKENFKAATFSGCRTVAMDVANIESVRDIFSQEQPELVIHAAATKFVDVSEVQPMETIDVNVLGSQNVARVAIDKGVKAVVGISTDKAAPPVRNTYGLSKAIMERMFCSMDGRGGTKFMCVRYGNVAWSTASVLVLWSEHLARQGVIETTGPEMFRFFFTVDEAVALVLTGIDNIDELHGSLLSRYMKAAQIKDILETWCKQESASWRQIPGRPGERNEETLIGELELPYTREVYYGGIKHYVITFNSLSSNPPSVRLSAGNTERLSTQEILQIVNNPPGDEK